MRTALMLAILLMATASAQISDESQPIRLFLDTEQGVVTTIPPAEHQFQGGEWHGETAFPRNDGTIAFDPPKPVFLDESKPIFLEFWINTDLPLPLDVSFVALDADGNTVFEGAQSMDLPPYTAFPISIPLDMHFNKFDGMSVELTWSHGTIIGSPTLYMAGHVSSLSAVIVEGEEPFAVVEAWSAWGAYDFDPMSVRVDFESPGLETVLGRSDASVENETLRWQVPLSPLDGNTTFSIGVGSWAMPGVTAWGELVQVDGTFQTTYEADGPFTIYAIPAQAESQSTPAPLLAALVPIALCLRKRRLQP